MTQHPLTDRLNEQLQKLLPPDGKMAIALSGGMDSSVLVAAAAALLGRENCLVLSIRTPYMRSEELADAARLCRALELRQEELSLPIPEEILDNPPLRCYLCKRRLFGALKAHAKDRRFPLLADGTNSDDLKDYRPGLKALRELEVVSPFLRVGFGKKEIRELASELQLPASFYNKPPCACLLTRLEHGQKVTEPMLEKVAQAESFLRKRGFESCRVRVHGSSVARIELPSPLIDQFWRQGYAPLVAQCFHQLGFSRVSLDLEGYTQGSMNQAHHE